jgi:hypothetical protein
LFVRSNDGIDRRSPACFWQFVIAPGCPRGALQ